MRLNAFTLVGWMLLAAGWTLGCASLIDRIPPDASTRSAMGETFVRIDAYVDQHGELPPDLSILPTRPDHANQTTDGWGYPLRYEVHEDGRITLESYGADGKAGGQGEDSDILMVQMPQPAPGQ